MRRRALAILLLLATLCGLGFLLRTGNAATVLVGDAVVFAENDPYYHMRRVFQILADYPSVPAFDPWIDYPQGAPVVFAPLFDFGVATLARSQGLGAADRLAVETVAALVPPTLGALTCLAVFWLGALATTCATALLAAALITLTPAHIWYSRLGFVDHHVAVTLLFVTTCALVLRALGVRPRAAAARGAPPAAVLFTALATLALGAGMLLWNGYLLLVAVLDLALLALFVAGDSARRRRIAGLVAVLHLGAALLVLPVVPGIVHQTGAAWSMVLLSYLHVAILAACAAIAAVASTLAARPPSRQRLRGVAVVAAGAVIVALVLSRGLLSSVRDWLFAADPFMGAVQESVSIVMTSDGRFDLGGALAWMGRFFVVVPLLLGLLAARVWRSGCTDEGRLFVLASSAVLFCLTLGQRRFGETAAPLLALLVADFLCEAARVVAAGLRARGVGAGVARAVVGTAVALLVAWSFAPYYRGFLVAPDRLTAILRAPVGAGAGSAVAFSASDRAQQEASAEVRLQRTLARFATVARRPDVGSAATPAPAGAMNPWPLGHKLLYVAGVPVTTTPFGSYVGGTGFGDAVDFYLATEESRALEILARRGSRWVVVDNDLGTIGAAIVGRGENPRTYYGKQQLDDGSLAYAFQAPLVRSLYFRLTKLGGSAAKVALPGGATESVPALDHLRLVIDAASDDAIGFAKVYEVVPGAVLVAHAVPGTPVVARYAYRSDAGRQRDWETSALADANGVARLVLPYSSERPDLGHTSSWSVESGGVTRSLQVTEEAVRSGRELSVTFE